MVDQILRNGRVQVRETQSDAGATRITDQVLSDACCSVMVLPGATASPVIQARVSSKEHVGRARRRPRARPGSQNSRFERPPLVGCCRSGVGSVTIMNTPVICQLSSFSPAYPGSFVDSLLQLSRTCRHALRLETLFVFPDRARPRKWLEKFDQEHLKYAFVPGNRDILASLRQVLKGFEPVLFHSHFSRFDLAAVLVKLALYRDSKVVWHLHSMAQFSPATNQRCDKTEASWTSVL
jgi:hypothetical protein